jgi:hypothetical protein
VLDARGNNRQVHAEFEIDEPSFAYRPDAEQGEKTIEVIFTRPNQTVVDMLERSRSLKKVRNHLPGEL